MAFLKRDLQEQQLGVEDGSQKDKSSVTGAGGTLKRINLILTPFLQTPFGGKKSFCFEVGACQLERTEDIRTGINLLLV